MPAPRQTFPARERLAGKKQFTAVFEAKTRVSRTFLTIYAKPNSLNFSRLGLNVSRRVGTAPKRNRIKRLLRESFRLTKNDLPSGYDWVIVVRPHEPAELSEYQSLLAEMTADLHKRCAGS
jgi:ribonuclease P protein component